MSLISELKRRNVIRVGAAYAVVTWGLAQVAEFAFGNFGAPDWALKTVVVGLLLGLPLALFFAWAFELTPDGVKREKDVDRSQSITSTTGRKLDRMIIGVLALALVWFAWDKFSRPTLSEAHNEILSQELSKKSVAVLPFLAMSSGADDEYFADGLTEEILNSLAQLPELLVTARTSAFSFKGKDVPIKEIAAALGVDHIVEGSVRRSGDRLRVTAQLIRASDAFHIWSENYDSRSTDTIAVQEDIAEKIASSMDIVLDDEKRTAMREAGLRDPEAFTLYQKAQELFYFAHGETETVPGLREANAYYDKVIARVPGFAKAYIDHSDLFIHMILDEATDRRVAGVTDDEATAALPAALKDYESAINHARTSEMRALAELDRAFLSGNWRDLGGRIENAMVQSKCGGGNSTSWLPNVLGYAPQNAERSTRILACDPLRSLAWFNLARATLWSGDKVGALRIAREGAQVAPGGWLATTLVRSLAANGLHDEAQQIVDSRFNDAEQVLVFSALVAAHSGNESRFAELLREYEQTEIIADKFWLPSLYAWGGQRDDANRVAASMDSHASGPLALLNIVQWCSCGEVWDMDATPAFAANIAEGNLPWPPPTILEFPLKTW